MDKIELDYKMLQLQKGDESAFEELFNETKKGLFSFILSICKNFHTAEDLMQTTYIKVRLSISSYRAGGNALAWIYTIAKNLTLNEIAKRKREICADVDQNEGLFGKYTLEEHLLSPVFATLAKVLNEEELQLVTLHIISGFKHREIAEFLSKPLGTVLWAYRNALTKVKKQIEKEGWYEN